MMTNKMILSDEKIMKSHNKPKSALGYAGLLDVDCRREKSWESIPSYFLTILFGFLLLLGYLTYLVEVAMPDVVPESEAGITRFSEERAWRYLREIVGDGQRVAGSVYHLQKTADLKEMVDEIARTAVQTVHTDWQLVTGDFWLDFTRPFLNVYGNVSNIIAVVEGASGFRPDGATASSVVFNCHYDTVPTSPGASDNALFCAAMMETLYLLSRRTQRLKHNVVFLFNGAEENPLQGVPGFLEHPWARGINGLVNLDSGGMNGKSLLFQVTDPRVVAAYSRSVPMPSAQAMGEVLFTSGIVPSDTDFRLFRDRASIYGVDIAFYMMGHVYHTRHDSLDHLEAGVIQHAGDLVHEMAKDMGDSDDFYAKGDRSAAVYYDYLNAFMLAYSYRTAAIVDSLIVIFGFASILYYHWLVGFRWRMTRELLFSISSRILSLLVGAAFLWILTAIMVATTIQLRYLSHAWIVVAVFWLPFLVGAVFTSQYFDAWRCNKVGLNRCRRVAQAMAATRLILVLITIILLCIPNTATVRYVITVPLLIMSVASFISLTIIRSVNIKAWQHIILEFLMAIPCLMFLFVLSIKVNSLMLPIMGRSPTMTPDYLVAGLNMALVMLCSLPLSGVELLFSRLRLWLTLVLAAVVCTVLMFIPFHPYRESATNPALQRHYWFHSEIVTYNQAGTVTDRKTGIWFGHTDANTPQSVMDAASQSDIHFTNEKTDFADDCHQYMYCNLPMVTPRSIENSPNSLWVDFPGPSVATPAPDFNFNARSCAGNLCTLAFDMIGPTHMAIAVSPRSGVNLTAWSFDAPVKKTVDWNGRPVYYIYYSRATHSDYVEPVHFSLTFMVPNPASSDPIIDLAFNAHRTNHENEFTQPFRTLMNAMPDWFNIQTFLSNRYNYVF